MTEDPRNNPLQGDETDADEIYDDEISLDELEGDISDTLGSADTGMPFPESAPQPFPSAGDESAADNIDDEVTLEELDGDSAGFFEVFAAPASPEFDAAPPDDAATDDLFEVQAAASPPPQAEAAPQIPPAASASAEHDNIRRLHGVEVEVIATLGTTRMKIQDILGLQIGSVVELHRMVGEPVDVTLNGRLIARGEVVVVDEKFAIRVHEIAGNGE